MIEELPYKTRNRSKVILFRRENFWFTFLEIDDKESKRHKLNFIAKEVWTPHSTNMDKDGNIIIDEDDCGSIIVYNEIFIELKNDGTKVFTCDRLEIY